IGAVAEFFSFGTNDLTQMTFGFSRDDVEGRIMTPYLEKKLIPANPFETLDQAGVGELVRWACAKGRGARETLKLGICGEHGGDPASVHFCHEVGLDYVSCSPFRVPLARRAAAADALGVSLARLRRLAACGRLVTVRTLGGHRRYREDDVLALQRWLQSRRAVGA